MRLSALVTLGVVAAALPVVAAGDEPRTEIAIFRYDGALSNSPAEQAFAAFEGMIRQKILNIQDHVSESLGAGSGQLGDLKDVLDLKVRLVESGADLSRSEITDWLGNEDDVLQAYLGTIVSTQGSFDLLTRCYLLDSEPDGGLRTFNLQTVVSSDEFANIRDSHSLMILYGIVLEARRVGVPRDKIAVLVSEAIGLIKDIEDRSPSPDASLERIRDAWMDLSRGM